MPDPLISIIAPIYNELENLPILYARVREVMEQTDASWELILVDDGSRDGSTDVIRKLASQDERVRPVIFARNFGHQIAVTAGMDYSRGEAVVIIDADLQDPPELIPEMMGKWREGYQIVYAVRSEREGETWFKKTTASVFYRLIDRITNIRIPLDTGDFRLIDRKALNIINNMREHNRFLRGMGAWVGFKQIGVTYKRSARYAGTSKYPFKKMIRLAANGVFGFSDFPLQLIVTSGAVVTALSLVFLLVMVILAIVHAAQITWPVMTLFTVLLVGGLILLGLGILGEYIGRIYDEAQGRPLYIVSEGPAANLDPTRLNRPNKNE